MRCFNHNDVEAVAICKCCGKGVCPECARDSATEVACSRKCIKKIKYEHNRTKLERKIAKAKGNFFIMLAKMLFAIGALITVVGGGGIGIYILILGYIIYFLASNTLDALIEDE